MGYKSESFDFEILIVDPAINRHRDIHFNDGRVSGLLQSTAVFMIQTGNYCNPLLIPHKKTAITSTHG